MFCFEKQLIYICKAYLFLISVNFQDSEVGLTSDPDEVDGMDTEEIAFQDAIVPYSDSYTEVRELRQSLG